MMIVALFENPVRHIKNFNVVVGTCMGKKWWNGTPSRPEWLPSYDFLLCSVLLLAFKANTHAVRGHCCRAVTHTPYVGTSIEHLFNPEINVKFDTYKASADYSCGCWEHYEYVSR